MAQAGSSRSRLNLVCAICREVYRSPRILPNCFHSFCVQCLERMAQNHGRTFPCPTCRTTVRVPEGGVQRFKVNFHIPEEDLEQERNEAFKAMCGIHPMEELIFFCKKCDQSICLRCRLTKHASDHHPTEDLSEAAARCKKKLRSSHKRLSKRRRKLTNISSLLNDNRKALKEKTDFLRKQVQEHYSSLITTVTKQRDRTLQDLTAVTETIDSDLSTRTSTVQQRQDSLRQLQERVDHAIDSNNHAEVVEVEKEVREGEGSVEKLEEMENGLLIMTRRPGLQGGMPVLRRQDVVRLFGTPVCLQLPYSPPEDIITRVYRCEKMNGCEEIHALQCFENELAIAYGGSPPSYEDERVITIDPCTGKQVGPATLAKTKVNFMGHGRSARNLSDRFTTERVIYSKSGCNARVVLQNSPPKAVLKCDTTSQWEEKELTLEMKDSLTPISIESNEDGDLFIVLSEEMSSARSDSMAMTTPSFPTVTSSSDSASSPRRLVQMYVPKQTKPVSQYIPPLAEQQPFFPTDLCLMDYGMIDEDYVCILLISDMANDSIHIVSAQNNQFSFHRYLANGSYILKPTALDCWDDIVYIGCQNGWVLKCALFYPESEEEEMEAEEWEKEWDTEQEEEEETSDVSNAGDIELALNWEQP